jgi:hypothetical protein
MRLESVRKALGGLAEEELQELVKKAYENDGWGVRNVHVQDPAHEGGADLVCEKAGESHLLAVKMRPAKGDVEQLHRLSERRAEGTLFYVFVTDPTVGFEKERRKLKDRVTFLGPAQLHMRFLQSEVIDYLVLYFGTLLVVSELAKGVTTLWQSRKGEVPNARGHGDYKSIYNLKDAVLKTRAALGVIALRWEYSLMQRTDVPKDEYDSILDEVVRDLDAVQRFTGGNLADEFEKAYERTPYVLSMIWKRVRERTDWNHFALRAEKISDARVVYEIAKYWWALPGASSPIPHSKMSRARMQFFCSGLIGILNNLAHVAKDLDDGVDWAWQDEFRRESDGNEVD